VKISSNNNVVMWRCQSSIPIAEIPRRVSVANQSRREQLILIVSLQLVGPMSIKTRNAPMNRLQFVSSAQRLIKKRAK
jgi:hypothetical protein